VYPVWGAVKIEVQIVTGKSEICNDGLISMHIRILMNMHGFVFVSEYVSVLIAALEYLIMKLTNHRCTSGGVVMQ
jgi:hypothetical protein